MQPNYNELGFSNCMGPQLRSLVEQQLGEDLRFYIKSGDLIRFDWSESCIEGHDAIVLDGTVENFSGIRLFNDKNELIAEGWMEFIHSDSFFIAYWEFLSIYDKGVEVRVKEEVGIPPHILSKIPENIKKEKD